MGEWAERFREWADAHTTNQRMEVLAVIEALREHPEGPVEIVSDSTYVVKCFTTSGISGGNDETGRTPKDNQSPIATSGRRSFHSSSRVGDPLPFHG